MIRRPSGPLTFTGPQVCHAELACTRGEIVPVVILSSAEVPANARLFECQKCLADRAFVDHWRSSGLMNVCTHVYVCALR
eukprot:COSAG01_NODE_2835_length_6985_cov_407.845083_4_plen_80_part_00